MHISDLDLWLGLNLRAERRRQVRFTRESKMSSKFLRKKLFVNPFAQGRTIAHVAFYWGVYHLILWHVMFLYRYCQYRGELAAGAPPRTFADLYGQFTLTHFSMLVCGLAILPLVMWDVLKLTHRFVGPLVRVKNSLAMLGRGEQVGEVRFRNGDFLIDLQESFNQFLKSPFCRQRQAELANAQIRPIELTEIMSGDELAEIGAAVQDIQTAIHEELVSAEKSQSGEFDGHAAPQNDPIAAGV